jgi:hypothetical protein
MFKFAWTINPFLGPGSCYCYGKNLGTYYCKWSELLDQAAC